MRGTGEAEPPLVDVRVAVRRAPPAGRIAAWARSLLSEAGARHASLSVLLCGDARMRALNSRWRRRNRPTDVLSFPSGDPAFSAFLGDLVIDLPLARRQGQKRGHSVGREVQILLAHGVLHLLGYDHETDDGTMFRRQRRLVRRVFGPGPDGVP